jgi:hypothetical protein
MVLITVFSLERGGGVGVCTVVTKKTSCKICHILREFCQKLPHLDTTFMHVTHTKSDFEKCLKLA